MPILQIDDAEIDFPEGTAPAEVAAAVNREARLTSYADIPWVKRAMAWDSPTVEVWSDMESSVADVSTVRTKSTFVPELGAEVIYPTLRMIDGELQEIENPLGAAIEMGDFILTSSPEETTRVSKDLSNMIGESRKAGFDEAMANLAAQGSIRPMNYRDKIELATAFTPILGDLQGIGYDAHMYETDPESHNWTNYLWSAAAAFPLLGAIVPSPAQIKRVFHSSAEKFDKFDNRFLHEGTGDTWYTMGSYHAENPKVGGKGGHYYKLLQQKAPDKLKESMKVTYKGKSAVELEEMGLDDWLEFSGLDAADKSPMSLKIEKSFYSEALRHDMADIEREIQSTSEKMAPLFEEIDDIHAQIGLREEARRSAELAQEWIKVDDINEQKKFLGQALHNKETSLKSLASRNTRYKNYRDIRLSSDVQHSGGPTLDGVPLAQIVEQKGGIPENVDTLSDEAFLLDNLLGGVTKEDTVKVLQDDILESAESIEGLEEQIKNYTEVLTLDIDMGPETRADLQDNLDDFQSALASHQNTLAQANRRLDLAERLEVPEMSPIAYESDISYRPDEIIDWDERLGDQPEVVEKLRARKGELGEVFTDNEWSNLENITGQEFLQTIENETLGTIRNVDKAKAADWFEVMDRIGIKGMKMKDKYSNMGVATEITRNWIIYDPKIISIAKRVGVSIPAAAMMYMTQKEREQNEKAAPEA